MGEQAMTPPDLKIARAGDAAHLEVAMLANVLAEAIMPYLASHHDPRNARALVMTAAAMFSGAQLGELIAMGEARDQDKKRYTDSMMRNFRQGIDVGKRKVARVMTESGQVQ